MGTIIIFVLILGLLIFVHELGHFVVAKKAGIKVEEFGFGYPPRIFGIKRKGTTYSLNWIPFGGFVKIKGEDDKDKLDDKDSYYSKKVWVRIAVSGAGVVMNFVLAFILLTVGFKIGLPSAVDDASSVKVKDQKIQIMEVTADSPALQAGLQVGDTIINIGGQEFKTVEEVQNLIKSKAGQEVVFKIKRGNELIEKKVSPRKDPPAGQGPLGVALIKTGIVSYSWPQSIWRGLVGTYAMTVAILAAFFDLIRNFIFGQKITADFAGPIGIAVLTGQVARMGFIYLLQFTAVLSVNLAIINILPFPALDGGKIAFLLIEKVKGKRISPKIENAVHSVGYYLLILLMVVVVFKDISRFKDVFVGFWQNLIK